jgi:hypothetical protein
LRFSRFELSDPDRRYTTLFYSVKKGEECIEIVERMYSELNEFIIIIASDASAIYSAPIYLHLEQSCPCQVKGKVSRLPLSACLYTL